MDARTEAHVRASLDFNNSSPFVHCIDLCRASSVGRPQCRRRARAARASGRPERTRVHALDHGARVGRRGVSCQGLASRGRVSFVRCVIQLFVPGITMVARRVLPAHRGRVGAPLNGALIVGACVPFFFGVGRRTPRRF